MFDSQIKIKIDSMMKKDKSRKTSNDNKLLCFFILFFGKIEYKGTFIIKEKIGLKYFRITCKLFIKVNLNKLF